MPGPRLLVLAPDPDGTVARDWVKSFLPGTAAVYRDHGILWLSARQAFRTSGIRVPDDVPGLIERVYGEAAGAEVPAGLEHNHQAARGERSAERSFALHNLLDLDAGYVRAGQPWPDETRVATRLADDRRTLRLARWDGATLAPLCPDLDPRRGWAMSEVSVRAARIGREAPATGPLAAAIAAARATWGRYEQDALLVALDADADGLRAEVVDAKDRPVVLRYRAGRGLEVRQPPGAGAGR
ncbi:hypothetical protein [Stella sp.]|uniref:hypothetical protein n=1 Tax=Stella sp. TaxID=2912054 RepID=UPI0035B3DE63